MKIQKKIVGYKLADENATPATPPAFTNEADRRLKLDRLPSPPLASLRWAKRPTLPAGNEAWTAMVHSPSGKFGVIVGHVQNGHAHPFEVWVVGEAPRGLSAIAKSLSMDMRTSDRAWLKAKLDALAKTPGTAFDMAMPDGTLTRVSSEVAAFARLVTWRCEQLGAFTAGATPVVDALMSPKEPKTTPQGTLAWAADIANPATGDDCVLFVKEATLPDGQRRPYSVWLAGRYPPSLDGLCKSLSLDLRVVDIAWALKKLQQLFDCEEARGEFMAIVPVSPDEKRAWYPSTVAYMARLIAHRLAMLGLATPEAAPSVPSGVVAMEAARERREEKAAQGNLCGECGAYAVRLIDGCATCTSCGNSKCG